MYVPCILYNLLFGPTNEQYINNNVCILKYCYMFRCIYIIFRKSLLFYAEVTKSIKFTVKFTYVIQSPM